MDVKNGGIETEYGLISAKFLDLLITIPEDELQELAELWRKGLQGRVETGKGKS